MSCIQLLNNLLCHCSRTICLQEGSHCRCIQFIFAGIVPYFKVHSDSHSIRLCSKLNIHQTQHWSTKYTNYIQLGVVYNARQLQAYTLSTLAVASSMTRILFLFKSALARHISCLCPMLKLDPPSVSKAFRPPGRSATTVFN